MKQPAYDECYINEMCLKIRYLFKLIARNCEDPFLVIVRYMKGNYRSGMDRGNPLYLNKTPKQILGDLGIKIDLSKDISEEYDEFILEWMADIYTRLQWKYNIKSSEIVEKIPPKKLYQMYYPLHEASVDAGIEKLVNICFREERNLTDGSDRK